MDEKAAFLVQAYVGNYITFELSFPIVITVHNSQDPSAWATIFWDNAFCTDPYTKVEDGPWLLLAEALNAKFEQEIGRGLSAENLQCLFEKLCNIPPNSKIIPDQSTVITWCQFSKDRLPGRDFTYWEWLYAAMKLIRHCLASIWQKGYVEGFIHKSTAEAKLLPCQNGTFLLRFSDSELGAISIAYVEDGFVNHIAPNNRKELESRDLVTRIRGLDDLHYIYPNVQKNVLVEFQTIPVKTRKGDYIQPITVDRLPSTSSMLNS